jgi:hypothetical protein
MLMSASPVNNAEYGGNVPRIGRPDNRSAIPIVAGATIGRSPLLRAIASDTWVLAREVSCRADRVEMENCYQFTDITFRMMRARGNTESDRSLSSPARRMKP